MIWTSDFQQFKKKVEPFFGKIEDLSKNYPDAYCHLVLSHGFMEYSLATKLSKKIEERIMKENNSFDIQKDHSLHLEYEKEEFKKWMKANSLEESLMERGWQEYIED